MATDVSVNQDEFETKYKALLSEKKTNNCVWNRADIEKMIQVLKTGSALETKSREFYNLSRRYELLQIGDKCRLIVKRKAVKDVENGEKHEKNDKDDKIIYIVPLEDFYSKILEAHSETGHGGRDRIMYYLKEKCRIPKEAVEIFVSCCEVCVRKKSSVRKGVVVKPIVSHGFNSRVQIDLIDLRSCEDDGFVYLLVVQDHATKFIQLRPLKSKSADDVAGELSKIFFTFGAPLILQSDNGREFVAAVINRLVSKWPRCKVVHGRPRHPQTQGSVERANGDIEKMLEAWMKDNKSTNWSRGCYEVQWQKNTSRHRIINKAPYEAVFGPIRMGLSTSDLPPEVVATIHTEEDLDQVTIALNGRNVDPNNQSLYLDGRLENIPENNVEEDESHYVSIPSNVEANDQNQDSCRQRTDGSLRDTNNIRLDERHNNDNEFCVVCDKNLVSNSTITCSKCDAKMHDVCGSLDLDTANSLICSLCIRGNMLSQSQNDCFQKQKIAAEKMVNFSSGMFPALNLGDCISLAVPTVDRGPLDFPRIIGVITDIQNGVYQIGTRDGVLKGWFPRVEIQKVEASLVLIDEVDKDTLLTLREAASKQSVFGGQGMKKCNCRAAQYQCRTNRCSCFKDKMKCGSRCHQSLPCCNK